jgi:hypothetical protein
MRSQGITGSYGYDRTKLPDAGMRSAARARRFDSDQHAARPRNFEDSSWSPHHPLGIHWVLGPGQETNPLELGH